MRTRVLFFLTVAFIALPQALASQDVAVAARIGTLGFGGELALGVSEKLVIRGGVGSLILDYTSDVDDLEYTITPPSVTGNVGIDFYPLGGWFRLMAGLMFQGGNWEAVSGPLSDYSGSIEIGDREYEEDGELSGILESNSTAPYVGLGFGHHTRGGFGVFMDFGLAFMGEPNLTFTATGDIASVPGIDDDLLKEAEDLEEEMGAAFEYWPILSLGLKIPFG